MFYKKGVLKNSAKITGKYLYQRLFFDKVAASSIPPEEVKEPLVF